MTKKFKQQMQMFVVVLGEHVYHHSLATNSGEAILRFLQMEGNGKYLDSGYDGMIKDGYQVAVVGLQVKTLEKLNG